MKSVNERQKLVFFFARCTNTHENTHIHTVVMGYMMMVFVDGQEIAVGVDGFEAPVVLLERALYLAVGVAARVANERVAQQVAEFEQHAHVLLLGLRWLGRCVGLFLVLVQKLPHELMVRQLESRSDQIEDRVSYRITQRRIILVSTYKLFVVKHGQVG